MNWLDNPQQKFSPRFHFLNITIFLNRTILLLYSFSCILLNVSLPAIMYLNVYNRRQLNWCRVKCHGCLQWRWEVTIFYWSTIASLKSIRAQVVGHWPCLFFKYVCKRDLKLTDINSGIWEQLVVDIRCCWCHAVQRGVMKGQNKQNQLLEIKRQWRKWRESNLRHSLYIPALSVKLTNVSIMQRLVC